jgi:hypothetical protein
LVFSAGVGAAVSIFIDRYVIAPSVSLYRGIDAPGLAIGPALVVSYSP